MKKFLLASLSILLAFLATEASAESLLATPGTVISDSDAVITNPSSVVSEKLLQEFRESFPNAERTNWYETDNRYIVSFVERGILSRITYKKNGSFINSFRYYGERDLPYYLITNLKKKYAGQKIFGVTEITTTSDIVYYVKLEGPRYWITVSLNSEGDCAIVESYR
ncbi:MAG TPA: hypothetical protein VNS58_07675 [Puia sp.]|nr:hypothetical protein [Puia sp.]